jgi:hypothetical protein
LYISAALASNIILMRIYNLYVYKIVLKSIKKYTHGVTQTQ